MSEEIPKLDIDESKFEMKPSKRPGFVTVISILFFVWGILYIINFINLRNLAASGFSINLLLINVIFLFIWSITAGVGSLLGKKWGWWLAILFYFNQIASQIITFFSLGSIVGEGSYLQNPFIQILLSIPTIIFLYRNSVLKFFKIDRFPKWKSLLILISITILIVGAFSTLSVLFRTGDAYAQLAFADYENGDYGKAIRRFEKSLTKGVNNYSEELIHRGLGHIYTNLGRWEEAITHFNAAIEINPDNATSWSDICILYRLIGDFDSALQSCGQVLVIDPDNALAHTNIGIIFFGKGDLQLSIQFLEYSLTLDPQLPLTHAQLALSYAYNGQFGDAELSLRQAEMFGYEDMTTLIKEVELIQNEN